MRTQEARFSVPRAVFADRISHSTRLILIWLISQTDFAGHCAVTYDEIIRGAGIKTRNRIADALAELQKLDWISSRKKSVHHGIRLHLHIPFRLRQKIGSGVLPEDVVIPANF